MNTNALPRGSLPFALPLGSLPLSTYLAFIWRVIKRFAVELVRIVEWDVER